MAPLSAGSREGIPLRGSTLRAPRRIASAADNLVSQRLFRFFLSMEVQKAARLRYSIGLVSMLLKPLGSAAARPDAVPVWRVGEAAAAKIRSTDLVTVTSINTIALLLVDAETPALPHVTSRVATVLAGVAVDGHVGALTWTGGGASYPANAGSSIELLRRVSTLTRRADAGGLAQLYLPS
jgi:hypothetical protein